MSMRVNEPLWRPREHTPEGGLPVPWVAQWSEERGVPGASVATLEALDRSLRVQYYPPSLQGEGEPLYGAVDTVRQITSFNEGRCQVCGALVQEPFTVINGTHPLTWISSHDEVREVFKDWIGQPVQIYDNPVCDECQGMALRLCPALKMTQPTVVRVSGFALSGAMVGKVGVPEDRGVHADALDEEFEEGNVIKQIFVTATLEEVL